MYNFAYVRKEERIHIKKFIVYSLNYVQSNLKKYYSYQYNFVGNELRSMMAKDDENKLAYQYDIEIIVNDENEYFTAKGLTMLFMDVLSQFQPKYKVDLVEDDDYIIQTKIQTKRTDDLEVRVDFSIIRFIGENKYVVRYSKINNSFYYEKQRDDNELSFKEQWCKDNNYWNDVRNLFLIEKNKEENRIYSDRELYANVLNNVYVNKTCENNI